MSFSANASSSRLVESTQHARRFESLNKQPDRLLARIAWQFLVLGVFTFAALQLFTATATSISNGRLWFVLLPLASLLTLYRHQLAARWARPAHGAPTRRSAGAARMAQSRVPRRAASSLRRAA